MQEFMKMIFALILLLFFPQTGQHEQSQFFCVSVCTRQWLYFSWQYVCTPFGVGPATRITQASLLNCGGSGIVLAIGSVLLLYSKRFRFLTAQQCLINPGLGDIDAGHWPQNKRGEFGKRLRVIMNSILTQQFNLLACQNWPSANPGESLISPVSLFFFSFSPSLPPPLPLHSLTLLLPHSFILMLTESVLE